MTTRILCFLPVLLLAESVNDPGGIYLGRDQAGHLVDVLEGKVLENAVVLVEGDKIKAVGRDLAVPAEAPVIDLGMPGCCPV